MQGGCRGERRVCVFVVRVDPSEAPPASRLEGVFGGGLVHQSLHRDAHLHQALLLQDVVRKTQFVLGDQPERKRSRRTQQGERSEGADAKKRKSSTGFRHGVVMTSFAFQNTFFY